MNQFVALLRGINVGGKNLIRMSDLKACFEEQGFGAVATYIQSGNVLFTSEELGQRLASRIEKALATRFSYGARIVLLSRRQLAQVIARAPAGFGAQPAKYRYDVIFLKDPLRATTAIKSVLTRPGVDEAIAGPGALYFSRLIAKASQSQLARVVSLPIYQQMTIRNWNTTTKLLRLIEASDQ